MKGKKQICYDCGREIQGSGFVFRPRPPKNSPEGKKRPSYICNRCAR